jgi:Na+-driven multidrug efflux pump
LTNTDPAAQPALYKRPTIWQLAVPSIMSNLMFSMVAMVQTKFVGGMGAPSVAAVGAGQRVFFALQALLMAIGVQANKKRPAALPHRRSCWAASWA